MTHSLDSRETISRRSMLGALGTAVGAAMAAPSLSIGSQRLLLDHGQRFVRDLGRPDLRCSAPGLLWADFDGGSITLSLQTTGRPVRLTAKAPLEYGGPEGSHVGLSFAEDGVDLHRAWEPGFAFARIDLGTIVSAKLEAVTVRQVPAGTHVWTLRVRHENPLTGSDAQRVYCRTHRIAPLEFAAFEL